MPNDVSFLERIITPLLQYPEKLVINRTVDEMGVLLTMQVEQPDMGRVLGRGGNTIKAIRTILHVYGQLFEERLNLKLLEPVGSTHFTKKPLSEVLSEIQASHE